MYTIFKLGEIYGRPDKVQNLKSPRLRWAGRMVRRGEKRASFTVLMGTIWKNNIDCDVLALEFEGAWMEEAKSRTG